MNVRSFGSAVSRLHISPFNAVKPADIALTSDAAQVAGLGRIYFALLDLGSSPVHMHLARTPPSLQGRHRTYT
ncbi:MAG TPA: hypothetical protein VEU11_12465 [Terriglobales bacterium]|nr:hypothetical protein [Terriglobales bacterium]